MKPRATTDADLAYWSDYDPQPVVIGGPCGYDEEGRPMIHATEDDEC